MDSIEKYTYLKGPLDIGCTGFVTYLPWEKNSLLASRTRDCEPHENILNSFIDDNNTTLSMRYDSFSSGIFVQSQSSQRSIEFDSIVDVAENIGNNSVNHERGGDLWNRVDEYISTIKNIDQRNRFIDFMRIESAKNCSENNPSYGDIGRGTLMLGCDESGRVDSGKRRRFCFEK